MYVTAHRVRSRRNEEGINAFLHNHTAEEQGAIDWSDERAVLTVAEGLVGTLAVQSYDVPPGGNHVLAYLDVVAPERSPADVIEKALAGFRIKLAGEGAPLIANMDGVGIRFGANIALDEQRLSEFDALRTRLLLILRSDRRPHDQQSPLEVVVEATGTGFAFSLTAESVDRVRKVHGTAGFTPGSFRITRENLLDFHTTHGDLVPHLISALTRLRLEHVISMGGVRFVDPENRELRRWPSEN